MLLFDYIFYRVSGFYHKWDDDTFYFYGVALVSILQLSFFIFILTLLAFISSNINHIVFEQGEGKNFLTSGIVLPVLIIFGLNLIRYLVFITYDNLNEKWEYESKLEKRKRKLQIIGLYIISIGITICLSIYRRYYI